MTVNDVDLVLQPAAHNVGFIVDPSVANRRLTFQHFDIHDSATALLAPHNSDARLSDSDEWPPALIFDVAYGCAALRTWGEPTFIEDARTHTKHLYYDNGDNNGNKNGDSRGAGPSGDGQGGRHSRQKIDRDARAARRAAERAKDSGHQAGSTADSEAPDIADIVLSFWMHNAGKVQHQVRAMKADRTQEKVGKWLNSVE